MKKNRMMRLASVLLVAVLLTTCAISGTFAKYVTQRSYSESARVAKFGIAITADGSLFSTQDPIEVSGTSISVESSTAESVVAPGTSHNLEDESGDNYKCLKFGVTGKPEVDVKIEFLENATTADIKMPYSTNYPDLTDELGNKIDMTASEDYYPIKYTLKHRVYSVSGETATPGEWSVVKDSSNNDLQDVKLSDIVDYLKGTTFEYERNTDLRTVFGDYVIEWEWAYHPDSPAWIDKADTFLGQLIAGVPGVEAPSGVTVVTTASLNLTIKVTQLD